MWHIKLFELVSLDLGETNRGTFMFLAIAFSLIHPCQVLHPLTPKHASYLVSDHSQIFGLRLAQLQKRAFLVWQPLKSTHLGCVHVHRLDVRLEELP